DSILLQRTDTYTITALAIGDVECAIREKLDSRLARIGIIIELNKPASASIGASVCNKCRIPGKRRVEEVKRSKTSTAGNWRAITSDDGICCRSVVVKKSCPAIVAVCWGGFIG